MEMTFIDCLILAFSFIAGLYVYEGIADRRRRKEDAIRRRREIEVMAHQIRTGTTIRPTTSRSSSGN
jgi:hypothetical protein